MKLHFLTAVIFLGCSSFLSTYSVFHLRSQSNSFNVIDFTAQRLSGDRVFILWHTEAEPQQIVYEVLRRHTKKDLFVSLGIVQPKSRGENFVEYAFIDNNNFEDSSYYCLKKIDADSVIFYSVTKAVEGIKNDRRM